MNEGWQALESGDQPGQQGELGEHPQHHQPAGLRQAREDIGLHIAALAAALKVPVKKIEALEAGRYEELPDMTFARALASSACRHMKIEAAPILDRIPHAHAPVLGGGAPGVSTAFKPDQGTASTGMLSGLKSPAALITGLVLLGALGVALLPDWQQWPGKGLLDQGQHWLQGLSPSSSSSTSPSGDESLVTPLELSLPATQVSDAEAPVSATSAEPVLEAPVLASAPSLGGPVETNLALAGTVLHLEAVAESWIEVIDGVGKVQIQRVIRQGDVLDFSGTPPYSVVLGRADAVTVQVRGKPFDVSPFARNSVARFSVR